MSPAEGYDPTRKGCPGYDTKLIPFLKILEDVKYLYISITPSPTLTQLVVPVRVSSIYIFVDYFY